jgi:hypothetical protein
MNLGARATREEHGEGQDNVPATLMATNGHPLYKKDPQLQCENIGDLENDVA